MFGGGAFIAKAVHRGRLTWKLQITQLERNLIFQTSIIMFHVSLQGCIQFQPCFNSIDMEGIDQSGRILCTQSSEILAPWDA